MDKTKYWNDHLSICLGPAWEDLIFLVNDDGIGRRATSTELREAAQYLEWVRARVLNELGS